MPRDPVPVSKRKQVSPRGADRAARLDALGFEQRAREVVRERAPEADLDAMGISFNVIRLTNRLVQDFESEVHRPAGLTWSGFRTLFALWVAGPLSPHDLARLASVSRASISSVLNTLERDELVDRSRSSADRRIVTVKLTRRGAELTASVFGAQSERERLWAACLTPREQKTFVDLLHKLLAFHPTGPVRRAGPAPDRS
jgi:DNA-binding MarR family transcriptional regulator